MANWYGTARSNYFRVKDPEAFKAWVNAMPALTLLEKDGKFGFYVDDSGGFPSFIDKHFTEVKGTIRSPQGESSHTFIHVAYGDAPDDEDVIADAATRHFHGLPEWMDQDNPTLDLEIDEESENAELDWKVDWGLLLAPHLAEGEVAVLMESGSESGTTVNYVSGYALAIAWDGRVTSVNLRDIYAKAAAEFGVDKNSITEAAMW